LGQPGTFGSPVDPSEAGPLGPLWPDGEPGGLAKYANRPAEEKSGGTSDESGGGAELVMEIDVPEGVTDDEVLAVIGRLTLGADRLHRDLGGHGLKVKSLEVFEGVAAPVEVPRG